MSKCTLNDPGYLQCCCQCKNLSPDPQKRGSYICNPVPDTPFYDMELHAIGCEHFTPLKVIGQAHNRNNQLNSTTEGNR